jgi:hypothetical protein
MQSVSPAAWFSQLFGDCGNILDFGDDLILLGTKGQDKWAGIPSNSRWMVIDSR